MLALVTVQSYVDANATRYLGAVGLVILIYDHLLTLPDEARYVWRAKHSIAKYLFLLNRYTAVATLFIVAFFMNHFTGAPFSDASVTIMLTIGFLLSFGASITCMVVTVIQLRPSIYYVSHLSSCVITQNTQFLVAVWACPMAFEVIVLVSTALNALNRPRHSQTPLTRVLHRDGILFFLALTSLRTINLVLAIVAPPPLIMLGAFFVWSMVTVVLNRSLLRIQKVQSSRHRLRHVLKPGSTSSVLELQPSPSASAFHLEGNIYPEDEDIDRIGEPEYEYELEDAFSRKEIKERELQLQHDARKLAQLQDWQRQINAHAMMMSGDCRVKRASASWSQWWQ